MRTMHAKILSCFVAFILPILANAQVNSGSDGHDGAFNPTQSVVIDMADHPDGIYHYTSVNIPAGVTVSFLPNAGNKPVVWLVQGNCVISGTINLTGKSVVNSVIATLVGPGGFTELSKKASYISQCL